MLDDKPVVLNTKNTYLSATAIGLIVATALWLKAGQNDSQLAANKVADELKHYKELVVLDKELTAKDNQMINAKLDAITKLYEQSQADKYTIREHKVFVERLQELNPSIKIPKE